MAFVCSLCVFICQFIFAQGSTGDLEEKAVPMGKPKLQILETCIPSVVLGKPLQIKTENIYLK